MAKKKKCLVITQPIKDLANSMQGETPATVAELVGLWQEEDISNRANNYPSIEELNEFKNNLRDNSANDNKPVAFDVSNIATVAEQAKVDLDFDPIVRRDRVTLIARYFSNEIDILLQESSDNLNKRIGETDSNVEANELRRELGSLDRKSIIDEYTPAGIFNRVKERYFDSYLNLTPEQRYELERNKLYGDTSVTDNYTNEQIDAAAQRRVDYNTIQFQKVSDNFRALAEESSIILLTTEGIRVDPNYDVTSDVSYNEDNGRGESYLDEAADDLNREETVKDGWMTNFVHVSSHEALSQEVRKTIRQIPRLDYEGYIDVDDLGYERFLEPDYVHAVLIDKLRHMTSSRDMLPLLRQLSNTKPWVGQVTELLEGNDQLMSQFYQDFRKDFVNYWIQKRKLNPDGTYTMSTIAINKPEGINYLFNEWRDNYESNTLLDEDSVYERDGSISIPNARKGLNIVQNLNNRLVNLSTEQRNEILRDPETLEQVTKVMNMIGITPNPSVLEEALFSVYEGTGVRTDPIMILLPTLNTIYNGIIKGNIQTTTRADSTERRGDLINTFGSAYNTIATMLAEVTEDAIESSVRENGKSYYSHVTPSYLGKLVKKLKNSFGTAQSLQEFINTQYKQFQWFNKDGRWRNDWLRLLESDKSMRDAFDHKVVLNSDRVEYTNWDDLDYTITLLSEYWGEPENTNRPHDFAWYYVPILSDAPSAEFIRFVKYKSGRIVDSLGNRRTYDDILLDKFTDLVNQEYDRIKLVIERDEQIQAGNTQIEPITNFDITRNRDGSIRSYGGSEFKFLPALNALRFEDTNESFLDRLGRLSQVGTGLEISTFIRESLSQIMNDGFEATYRQWYRSGLLNETEDGKMMYLPFTAQSNINRSISRAMLRSKELMGNNWTPEMEQLLGEINSNRPYLDNIANNTLTQIRDIVSDMFRNNLLSQAEYNRLINNLQLQNPAKEALREYYWNSQFATSQIIQLTTTDLAYYKDLEDFQKRYKEIHSPALRMNTEAMFNGERIGRDFERTIILADDIITSEAINDISEILQNRVSQGLMTKIDMDNILSKFREVNVADAQAYRSLSSYRAVMGMSGKWTEQMQRAYDNFQNGIWDMRDFDVLWQPIKPFVYTQVEKDSGIENVGNIKVPVQHKNSELLLLAMHELVAGPEGRSGKLRAINEFMESHNIDVVQFESTTKVGKQGVIDINDLPNPNLVTEALEDATQINGEENPNVIHKISYEDYGIQVATPEHSIDAVSLIGSQIRKLITADIADTAIIEVDGQSMTKSEWLDMYQAINTENILQSFINVNDRFRDIRQIEQVLLDEVRSNQRYGIDMIRAVTLNERGQFNIPLFDPVHSQRVQQLLNSVIKSNITKQKIKGGALIQASAYGLTNELSIVFEGEGNNKRIKHIEVFMPWYTRKFLEPLINEGSHILDITQVPEDLRRLIGYRIPTEDKYSMVPLYIKDFLPRQSGGAIMLPAEITTLSGGDFDVDKLYIMIPEFRVNRNNNTIHKVKYNFDLSPAENSLAARNNLMIDLMWGILTNPDTAAKMLNPGGFDYQKRSARIITILQNATESELRRELGLRKDQDIISRLMTISMSDSAKDNNIDLGLDSLAKRYRRTMNPLSPRTQVLLHQQNMTGAKLIGIFANHNANHALMQHTNLGVHSEYGAFTLNDKTLTSLHNIMNDQREFISRNNAGYLAASVDNVKDPVLASMNLNTFTSNPAMLLSRLGYTPIEVGLLLSQPIIVDITNTYARESRNGIDSHTVVSNVIEDYRRRASMMEAETYDNYKDNNFNIRDLANNIMIAKEMDYITSASETTDYNKVQFYRKQVAVGYLFSRILNTSDALGQLVQATRSDTSGGGAGPTIAHTKLKIQRVQDFIEEVENNPKFPLINANVIRDDINTNLNSDELRQELLNSPIPFLQAFYTLGVKASETLLRPYFPQFTQSFDKVMNNLRSITRSGRLDVNTMNNIYNDLLAYIMSNTGFFGTEVDINGNMITSTEKRRDFINNFPEYFKQTINNNPEISDLEFIKRLKVVPPNNTNPLSSVVFTNVGQLSSTLRERYMRDWANLLYMRNPEAQKLAVNLFRYSYYRNGFAFGPSTFIHLAPTAIRLSVPEYVQTLNNIIESQDDYREFNNQYIYNHLDNKRLVPEISNQSTIDFINEDGSIKESITVTIDGRLNSADKKLLLSQSEDINSTLFELVYYFGHRVGDQMVYYRKVNEELSGDMLEVIANYERIDPLGYRNNFIEYEYSREVDSIESVIPQNDRNYVPESLTRTVGAIREDTPYYDPTDLDFMPQSRLTNTETAVAANEVLDQAMMDIFGVTLNEAPIGETNFTDLESNTEYIDENGQKVCGAIPLFKL